MGSEFNKGDTLGSNSRHIGWHFDVSDLTEFIDGRSETIFSGREGKVTYKKLTGIEFTRITTFRLIIIILKARIKLRIVYMLSLSFLVG